MNHEDYEALGQDTSGKKIKWEAQGPDGTMGRIRFSRGGQPADKEAWGDLDYGIKKSGGVRCTAIKKSGKRCRKWAMQGTHLCTMHGGYLMTKRNGHTSYGLDLLGGERRTVGQAFNDAMKDPELTNGRAEAALGRAILSTTVGKHVGRNAEGLSVEQATELLNMVSLTQRMCLGPAALELRSRNVVSLTEFYLIANQLMDQVYMELRRLAPTEEHASEAVKRIAQSLLTMEIKGERIFEGQVTEDDMTSGLTDDFEDDDDEAATERQGSDRPARDANADGEPGDENAQQDAKHRPYYPDTIPPGPADAHAGEPSDEDPDEDDNE